ncbi:alanine racemase [Amygdalobacter nucleatus]|uniref:alanine racemase n=1 Tax=Amygdalobacter nucleatus TaxID=3029274 RepID=UPI0027A39EA6|nr:alanine racemase [Amygdalobacter nucleatus]WEG36848.1 alanine racemase [Amygdalobacter nucleatus]
MNDTKLKLAEFNKIARNYLLVDLDQAKENAQAIKSYIGPETKLLAVVKANAYGHGVLECARAFIAGGADYLGVAAADAALYLRKSGITVPILMFSDAEQLNYPTLVANDIEPAVYSAVVGRKLSLAAQAQHKQARYHLVADTGMSRIGFPSRLMLSALNEADLANLNVSADLQAALDLCRTQLKKLRSAGYLIENLSRELLEEAKQDWQTVRQLLADPNLSCQGIFSHFAKADCLGEAAFKRTEEQYLLLSAFAAYLIALGYKLPLRHIANSAATVRYPEYYLDMVRPGSVLYGLPPANSPAKLPMHVKPIARWFAKIDRIFVLRANQAVSYGGLWQSETDTLVGVLAVGYADGYRRNLSNKAYVLLPTGEKAEVLGRVCMDYCMVKLPWSYAKNLRQDISQLEPVEIMGDGSNLALTADNLAELADSFNLEVCCSVAARVLRVYLQDGKVKSKRSYLFDTNSGAF